MDELLGAAVAGRAPLDLERQPANVEKPTLPEVPSREDLVAAVKKLAPAVSACNKGLPGLAEVGITVAASGKVVSARMTGPPYAGTASGACIEGVLRRARFPRFARPQFRVRIPFSLR